MLRFNQIVCHDRGHQMTDPSRTNQDQIKEISILKQRIQELEQSESKCKRVEEALQKSEEKFLELLEHINDIFYELDETENNTVLQPFH